MCRSRREGGRRCKCDFGAHRRAAQRARYAAKKSAESIDFAGFPITVSEPVAGVYASHTSVSPVHRDPVKTRVEAGEALDTLRGLPHSDWFRSGELKAYVSAVVTHGAVLRDNVACATEQAWKNAGVSDEAIEQWVVAKRKHRARKADVDARMEELIAEEEQIKKDNPNWFKESDTAAKCRALSDEWASLLDGWFNEATRLDSQIRKVNETRRELYLSEVRKVLEGERELGGHPTLSARTAMSKPDVSMFEDVVSNFPSDMVKFANSRTVPLRPMRSKKRAHYGGRVKQKEKVVMAGILNAQHAIQGSISWADRQDHTTLDNDVLESIHVPHRETVEDTPANKAELERMIEEWKADQHSQGKKRILKGKTPTIATVQYEIDGKMEERLALYVPEAHVNMYNGHVAPVGELTFNDRASMAHEFGHHIEFDNPEVGLACKEFLRRRTDGFERVTYMKGSGRGKKKKPNEIVTPDGFVDSYIGKHYDDSRYHTEIFSMGVEAVFAGRYGGLLGIEVDTVTSEKEGKVNRRYRADPEHFALVMGILATANGTVSVP